VEVSRLGGGDVAGLCTSLSFDRPRTNGVGALICFEGLRSFESLRSFEGLRMSGSGEFLEEGGGFADVGFDVFGAGNKGVGRGVAEGVDALGEVVGRGLDGDWRTPGSICETKRR
jgi:hypothetical protein